jgi:WD40 repeat protein
VDSSRRLWITFLASLIGLASLGALLVFLGYINNNDLTALFPYTKKYFGESVNTQEVTQTAPEAVVVPAVTTNDTTQAQSVISPVEPIKDTEKPLNTLDETPTPRPETGLHTAAINQVAVTHDGRLLTASDDKTARLWSADTTGSPLVLRVPIGARSEGALYAVAASPTKNSAVVGGSTGIDWDKAGSVYGFDLNTGKITGRITGIQGTIRVLNYSQDGRYLAIGSGSGWLRIIDIEGKSLAMDASICEDMLVAAKFLRDGRLVTACLDGQLQLYDPSFHLQANYKFSEQRPWHFAVSPKEDQIAVGSLDTAKVTVFSLADLKPVTELTGDRQQRGNLSVVAWIGDSVFGAGTYGNAQGTKYLRVWNTLNQQTQELPLAEDTVTDLTALADGKLAYVTAEPSIGIIDPNSSKTTTRKRAIADFRDAFEGTFAVSEDGATVDFGLQQKGRTPLRFNLTDRTLVHALSPRNDMHKPIIPTALTNWRNATHTTLNTTPVALDQNEQSRSAASLVENDSIVIGADFSLQYWQTGKLLWQIAVPSTAWAVNLSKNTRFVLAALGDGTLRWYDTKDGRELLALLVNTDERWIAWTPEGYFDHSDGAASLIGYHINQGKKDSPKFILSDQIHERFYRPDLIGKSILENIALTAPATNPDNAKTVVAEHHAPSVRLVSWCVQGNCTEVNSVDEIPQTRSVDSAEITLRFALKDSGGGIGNVVIRRNKATIETRALHISEMPKNRGAEAIVEEKILLEPGDNLVTVTAFDADQTIDAGEAIRLPIHYQASTAPDAPTLYIVSVGIDQYAATELPKLDNAVNDAKAIIETLIRNSNGLFAAVKPIGLLNEQAGLNKIKQALTQVSKQAKPNDLVVLFLAGHGISLEGRYYFMPYDAKLAGNTKEQIKTSSLTQKALSDLLSALPTSRVAVLIDSCNSGAFAVMGSVIQHSSPQERAWTGSLAQNTGRFVLAGTSTEQEALDGINGHGVFTAVLLEGLSGKADQEVNGNHDQRIDIYELQKYTSQRVPEEARKISPTHAQNVSGFFAGSDFFDLTKSKP